MWHVHVHDCTHTYIQMLVNPQAMLMDLLPFTMYQIDVEARNMYTSSRFPDLFGKERIFQTTEGSETKRLNTFKPPLSPPLSLCLPLSLLSTHSTRQH